LRRNDFAEAERRLQVLVRRQPRSGRPVLSGRDRVVPPARS
jgi:hypothetical protein